MIKLSDLETFDCFHDDVPLEIVEGKYLLCEECKKEFERQSGSVTR